MVMAGRPSHFAAARQAGHGALAVVVLICTVVMAGETMTMTLSILWVSKFGFGPVITAALALTALSSLGFALATGLAILLISRALSRTATALITATATSSIAEIVPGRRGGAVPATAADVGGLSLGTIAAGLLAQFVQAPTRTVFWCYLVVCAVARIAWLAGRRTRGPPRIRRPSGMSRARLFPAGGCSSPRPPA
ncbi:MFS transporter [Spirillospora sp. NPDC046719]